MIFKVNLGFNWKKLKFRDQIVIFKKLISSNQEFNCKNIEVWWTIRNLIEEIWNQWPNWKRCVIVGVVIDQIQGQIEYNWTFDSQLKVEVHKSEIKDQDKNNAKFRG